MTMTDVPPRGSGDPRENAESEPTPTPAVWGAGRQGGRGEGSTRAGAPARARWTLPQAPNLRLRAWFVRDEESPLKQVFPRCKDRFDHALRGTWTAPNPVDENGVVQFSNRRLLYLGLTLLFACPVAIAIDLLDWISFPLGRLIPALIVLIVIIVSL